MQDFNEEYIKILEAKKEVLEKLNRLLMVPEVKKYITLISIEKELNNKEEMLLINEKRKEDKTKKLENTLNEPRSIWDWPL